MYDFGDVSIMCEFNYVYVKSFCILRLELGFILFQ